ncbi:hypothetical protein KQI65_15845 [bacterium]|nr:hypothetical protein [bacterium]
MQLENEFAEDHVHEDIRLEYAMTEFLHKALRYEEKRLGWRMHPIEDHPELSWLATDSSQLEVYRHTYKWTGKFRQFFDGLLQTSGGQDEIQLGDMKHGLLRKLKSIGLAYIGFLREELQTYGEQPYQAPPLYRDIEDRITELEKSFSQQPFEAVSPVELLP